MIDRHGIVVFRVHSILCWALPREVDNSRGLTELKCQFELVRTGVARAYDVDAAHGLEVTPNRI